MMTQPPQQPDCAPCADLCEGRRFRPVAWIRGLGRLGCCGAILAATALSGTAQETPDPPQPTADAGIHLLEQMEAALVATVRDAGPSVVTVEGKVPMPQLKIRRIRRAGTSMRTGRAGKRNGAGTETQSAERTAQEATQIAEKTLEEVRKQIQTLGGIPVTGSGFLLHGGFVVTTAEVVRGVSHPFVVLSDGTRIKSDWVNPDPVANIAVLRVSGIDPQLGLRWGDSSRLFRGSFVLTIGNQAGFPNSFSLGSVAGIGRAGLSGALRYNNLIQFQGVVGAGGSGGPLLNIRGEVVGMVVAAPANAVGMRIAPPTVVGMRIAPPTVVGMRIAPPTLPDSFDTGRRSGAAPCPQPAVSFGSARAVLVGQETQDDTEDMDPQPDQSRNRRQDEEGSDLPMPMPPAPFFGATANTGFALPSNDIRPAVELLSKRASPAFRPGWMGVDLVYSAAVAPGARVSGVYVGSPADKVGLQPGDILVSINGQPPGKESALRNRLLRLNAGDTLKVEILRGTTRHVLDMEIDAMPDKYIIHRIPVRRLRPKTTLIEPVVCSPRQAV